MKFLSEIKLHLMHYILAQRLKIR